MKRPDYRIANASPEGEGRSRNSIPRWAAIAGGVGLTFYGLTRRSKTGAALAGAGGLILLRGAQNKHRKQTATASFLIQCSPEEAYLFWHDFENLPRFMRNLVSVKMTGPEESEWIARGPRDIQIRWMARTTEDRPNERIGWESLPGSDLWTSGSVEFRPAPSNRGTIVRARLQYSLPATALSRSIVTAFGKHPEFLVREDLRRFKALIETGEVPTTVGQPHGPRGVHGRVEQVLFREEWEAEPAKAARPARHSA